MRDRILACAQEEMMNEVLDYIKNYLMQTIEKYCLPDVFYEEWNIKGLHEELSFVFLRFHKTIDDLKELEKEQIEQIVLGEYEKLKADLLTLKDDEMLATQLKRFMIQTIDSHWIRHLDTITNIKDGIHLRGYGQEDPYRLFEIEAFHEFVRLQQDIQANISIRFMNYVKSQFELDGNQ